VADGGKFSLEIFGETKNSPMPRALASMVSPEVRSYESFAALAEAPRHLPAAVYSYPGPHNIKQTIMNML
jgi:hypothetical protein